LASLPAKSVRVSELLKFFVHLKATQKFSQGYAKAASYFVNVAERNISLAPLNSSNIRPVQSALLGKSLLGQAGLEPKFTKSLPKSYKNILFLGHFLEGILISVGFESTDDE